MDREGMEKGIDKGLLHLGELQDVPFFAGDDFKEDFLTRALTRAEVGDEILLCNLTPGLGREDATAGGLGGHVGVGRGGAEGLGRACIERLVKVGRGRAGGSGFGDGLERRGDVGL